jgi:hypothetical protein
MLRAILWVLLMIGTAVGFYANVGRDEIISNMVSVGFPSPVAHLVASLPLWVFTPHFLIALVVLAALVLSYPSRWAGPRNVMRYLLSVARSTFWQDDTFIPVREALKTIAHHYRGAAYRSSDRHWLFAALSILQEALVDPGSGLRMKGKRIIEPNVGYGDIHSDWEWIEPEYWRTHEIDFTVAIEGWDGNQHKFETRVRNKMDPLGTSKPLYRYLRLPRSAMLSQWPPPAPWKQPLWRDQGEVQS